MESQDLSSWLSPKSIALNHHTIMPSDIINYSPDKSQKIMKVHNILIPETQILLYSLFYWNEYRQYSIRNYSIIILEAKKSCMLPPSPFSIIHLFPLSWIFTHFASVAPYPYFIALFIHNILCLAPKFFFSTISDCWMLFFLNFHGLLHFSYLMV